jgi:hypothetical protein
MIVLSHWQKKKIRREREREREKCQATDVDARLRVRKRMITIVKSSYVYECTYFREQANRR